jgi:hypothetical protein
MELQENGGKCKIGFKKVKINGRKIPCKKNPEIIKN